MTNRRAGGRFCRGGIPLSYIHLVNWFYAAARHIDQNLGCSEVGGNFVTDLTRGRIEPTDQMS